MQTPETSFYDWQKRFTTEQDCLGEIMNLRWPDGFRCPHCGHDHGWLYVPRRRYECAHCFRQISITSGTVFHGSRIPLTKWFWTIYLVSANKGDISALHLSKIIGVTWRTAYGMLRKLRQAMGKRDSEYSLTHLIDVNDAYCPICKSTLTEKIGIFFLRDFDPDKNIQYSKCNNCNHHFSSSNVEDNVLKKYYNYKFKDGNYNDYAKHNTDKRIEFDNIIKKFIIPNISKESMIFEIGCAEGFFLQQLSSFGYKKLSGYDISEVAINNASERLPGSIKLFDPAKYELADIFNENKFDMIIGVDVMDHLLDPCLYMRQIYNGLKTNGLVFFIVANVDSLAFKILKTKWPYFLPFEHLNLFSKKSMRILLEDARFENIVIDNEKRYFSFNYVIDCLESIYKLKGKIWNSFKNISKWFIYVFKGIKVDIGIMTILAKKSTTMD